MCIYVLDGINDLNPQTIRKKKQNLEKLFQEYNEFIAREII